MPRLSSIIFSEARRRHPLEWRTWVDLLPSNIPRDQGFDLINRHSQKRTLIIEYIPVGLPEEPPPIVHGTLQSQLHLHCGLHRKKPTNSLRTAVGTFAVWSAVYYSGRSRVFDHPAHHPLQAELKSKFHRSRASVSTHSFDYQAEERRPTPVAPLRSTRTRTRQG